MSLRIWVASWLVAPRTGAWIETFSARTPSPLMPSLPARERGLKRHPLADVDIPVAFFKVIVDEVGGKPRMLGFVMPQEVKGDEAPRQFLKDVKTIEKLTHLDFFWKLDHDVEEKLESETPREMW